MNNEREVGNKKAAINVGYQFGRKSVKKEESYEGGKAGGSGDIKACSIV